MSVTRAFVVDRSAYTPSYLELARNGELQERARIAVSRLTDCTLCPRACHVDRNANETSVCRSGRRAKVSSAFAHFGEEDCLRGRYGSGTIFFSWCGLRCVFCQNFEISWEGEGAEKTPEQIAMLMLELQGQGCHNVNLVTPSHVVPQILEALVIAAERGLHVPLVYNSGGYDSADTLALLDGVIDVYMPDFKFWDDTAAQRYAKADDYPDAARRAILEMHRQTGALVLDEDGNALRGVLLRHLVLPGGIAGTNEIMQWVASEVSPDTFVNLMPQYRPAGKVHGDQYEEIGRPIRIDEFRNALHAARAAGLWRFDLRSIVRFEALAE